MEFTFHFTFTINLEESYLVPRYRRLTLVESYSYPRYRRLTFEESYLVPRYRRALASLAFGSGGGGRRREEMASSLTIKESFKGKYSTCKTSAGVNPASIFQRNPFKNFFHSICFPGKSLVKNSKLTFNFT